ncbi:MAG: metallophosphoesterase family protein [Alphaproteobacteria bacterium]|nr:metallophosphoesterase family protein [Alphaproteobacteria bacterium]
MSILLLSDAHLHGLEDPNQRALLCFLEAVPFDELVLVGDIFDVWWAGDGAVPLDAVPVVSALHRLVEAGRRVTWIAGNHDWAPRVEGLGIAVADAWRSQVGTRRLLAVHGDEGADPRLRNRLFQRAIRSRAAGHAGRALGAERVRRIGRAITTQSRRSHGARHFEVLQRQNELADRLLGTEADVLFVGHSHAPGMLPRRAGTLVNLGDWLHHKTYARVAPDAVRLFRWTGEETAMPEGPPQRWPWADRY